MQASENLSGSWGDKSSYMQKKGSRNDRILGANDVQVHFNDPTTTENLLHGRLGEQDLTSKSPPYIRYTCPNSARYTRSSLLERCQAKPHTLPAPGASSQQTHCNSRCKSSTSYS